MSSLAGQYVFLSASFPSGERARRFPPFDPGEIADAVTAVVRAVLKGDGKLLFGGHPTITPLVLMIASELNRKAVVDVFQSHWFEDQITPEVHALAEAGYGCIHWTPKLESREQSLQEMRREMLCFDQPIAAGVFVGGMEGIRDEFDQFGASVQNAPRIPLPGAGGAAAQLPLDYAKHILGDHMESRHYPFVASLMVERLADAVGPEEIITHDPNSFF